MFDSDDEARQRLAAFVGRSGFRDRGAVITDLDGTAVHEHEGRVRIARSVVEGLEAVHAAGRQVVINSLRFPLSVIRVFGDEWVAAANGSVPVISLKGSQVGRLIARGGGAPVEFEEIESTLLDDAEIDEAMRGVEGVVDAGRGDIVVFYYPLDWRIGEIIWTPRPERVAALRAKYLSATDVTTSTPHELRQRLGELPLCMIFLLIEHPGDERMAYQHIEVSSFFTHRGIDKRHGTEVLARHLGIDLAASIGAGDAPPDTFLQATGLAVIVGPGELGLKGRIDTLRLPDAAAFGRLLTALGRQLGQP